MSMVVDLSVSEERCNEVESLVFDLFANLGATGKNYNFESVSLALVITWMEYYQ